MSPKRTAPANPVAATRITDPTPSGWGSPVPDAPERNPATIITTMSFQGMG